MKKLLNFVLCDDNLNILNKLSHMLESIFISNNFNAQVTYKTSSDTEILNYMQNNVIDVLILDINLHSNLNGLQIANQLRKINKDCYIIFTTGHSEYVFMAYQCKTFDFLCKPLTKDRLEETIKRLFEDINGIKSTKKYIKLDNKNTFIDENEIQYIKREGMKLIFHTPSKNYEIYSSFNKLQNQLPQNFIRCHKSFIANIKKISNVEATSNTIYFSNNTSCYIGPKYKDDFMKEVKLYGHFK